MKNLSILLSSLTILVCVIGIWKINGKITRIEDQRVAIKVSQENLENVKTASKEFSDEHAVRFSRERRKNQELEEEFLNLSRENSTLETSFTTKNAEVDNFKRSKEENEKKLVDLKVELLGVGKKIEATKKKISEIELQFPQIESEIKRIELESQNQVQRSREISEILKGYNSITAVLKEHFERTIDSLLTQKYTRPWLEEGEVLKMKSFTLDLDNGILALPVGNEIGVETGKFFSIANAGELICKIRIKESGQNKSVALIMPLFGNPQKLLELKSFDLKHL